MGRRPNPLVVEFFERGEKLKDASNRYQMTCKRCGELFPKGRTDSLTTHLLRKCQNVTQADRAWVCHQIQQNPERPTDVQNDNSSNDLGFKLRQDESGFGDLTLQIQQQQSALDTLAEVSKHHLDYSAHREPNEHFQDPKPNKRLGEVLAEQALVAQLQNPGISNGSALESTNSFRYTAAAPPPPSSSALEVGLTTTAVLSTSPLVQAASAANQQLEQAQAESAQRDPTGSFVDPQLQDHGRPLQPRPEEDTLFEYQLRGAEPMTWGFPQKSFGTLSMPPDESTGYGVLQKPNKNKTRSRFNDSRRKEVQEVRKRGACLRCRMLKKPCSEGTPCGTCKNVESARLWTGTCLRTRLAEEFTLWSTNLVHAKANIDIPAAVQGLERAPLIGCIEARVFTSSNITLSFAANEYCDADRDKRNSIWLLDESSITVNKLQAYAKDAIDVGIAEEPSTFLKATLQRARCLTNEEAAENGAKPANAPEQMSPRTCYNLHNQLLEDVAELSLLTSLLTSSNHHSMQLRYDASRLPREQHDSCAWTTEMPQCIPQSSLSYGLICSQIMAVVEERCSKLSKTIMNELERRLLQRQQASGFATFLSAVILLSCVERMTGFYRRFDAEDQPNSPSDQQEVPAEQPAATTMPVRELGGPASTDKHQSNGWPLDTPPSTLWRQGPHFAELLAMLLRMRALPPRTCQNADGSLGLVYEHAVPVRVNGRPVRERVDDLTRNAAAWLDPLKLDVGELVRKRDGELPGHNDLVEAWDMIFVSMVLLPERAR